MIDFSAPVWVTYLLSIALAIAFVTLFACGGVAVRDRYLHARSNREPARWLWLVVMWVCFVVAAAVVAGGLYLFVTERSP